MKHKCMILSLICGLAVGSGAATFTENVAIIDAYTTAAEAVTFWGTLPAEEQVYWVASSITRKYHNTEDWQGLVDFANTTSFAYPPVYLTKALFMLDQMDVVEAYAVPILVTNPDGFDEFENLRYRSLVCEYLHFSRLADYNLSQTNTQIADYLVKALKLPITDLSGSFRKCVESYRQYGRFSSIAPATVYMYLENVNKPNITTAEEALWWGINITSRVR